MASPVGGGALGKLPSQRAFEGGKERKKIVDLVVLSLRSSEGLEFRKSPNTPWSLSVQERRWL